ncbi:LysR family transcriptional regulator [Roseibium algicola]|jgi:DNA-binding transcriptional LysR family regulator|uniref:LysR family transcriptional regulator n=1 Tax=Roseibium algicola TaxID=2857014 RepID=A0ABN4WSY8_9HYPH|nr:MULTISPECIES: LysR family transcriptional regulator [Stappiaceae]MCR9285638.1 LysR family transcriptional regulator [Paracoccaceae bacterium]MEC9419207.1 LysR family transcriptional regulator [Pseudomonadota bacterium]AMN55455.1 LysR family transcriptional regulator [Labrenzia sp. CP4]AQQ04086.1 LysR family transcriptional regulator [Roseibium aggregatum]ERP97499.1 LysR family transcriptional regulator [Labrenzia sp. C1B10]
MSYLESLRVFTRVVELGSITSGGRDLRLTPAVASKRIKELEKHLGVRLFNRTTRSLTPTEVGKVFYDYAVKALESIEDAEAAVASFSDTPRGVIRVTAPLGAGRRIIAPLVPRFVEKFPATEVHMRLSDRKVDILSDGLDVAFFIGTPQDSNLKLRKISDCPRVLCAAPEYLEKHGTPRTPDDLLSDEHNCLLLRYPRSPEYYWVLQTPAGPRKLQVSGKMDADHGDVLTDWALSGYGIVNKPRFDVAQHLESGRLVEILKDTPPPPTIFGCLYPHRRLQDPKIRHFVDFVISNADVAG